MGEKSKTGFGEMVFDFLFIRSCFVCGKNGPDICSDCLSQLPKARLGCIKCGRKNPFGMYCYGCRKQNQADIVLAQYHFSGSIRELIHQFKYEDVSSLKEVLGEVCAKQIKKISGYKKFSLTYIPLSYHREKWRGYNQARLLAEVVSDILKMPLTDLLTRAEAKESQVKVEDKKSRKDNIRGVFSLKKGVDIPQKVILIDDVITTGATIEEATKVLKKSGVETVIVIAVSMV